MRVNKISIIAAMVLLFAAGASSVSIGATGSQQAETVIRTAAKQGRYTFVTFYKKNDQASTKMLAEAKKAQGKLSARASFTSVDVADAAHRTLIRRYGVDRSPIPLMLVLAPNGAVTAGFPNMVRNADFSNAFVSKGKAEVLKALQDQKMAVLCLQNSRTKHNNESLAAVRGLASAKDYAGKVRIIRIDPADRGEAKLLKEIKANSKSPEAQVIVIASSGKLAGNFSGAVSTKTMVASLNKACGTSGSCGPAG